MESDPLTNLREWAPLNDLLNKIPARVQKGFLYQEVNITCVDVLPSFIALGTNVGIVFWYNRCTGDIQKLRCEFTSAITCLKVISSVEYLVAAGSISGRVSVFIIQKEHSIELNLVAPLTKLKPIERYTIKDLHNCPIRCVEWSKNGMKLFSGDANGVVVLTEFDFQTHISKSIEILNEAYEIVQITFSQPWLLISTIYRAIICERQQSDGTWKVSQIGKRDRKVLSDFGATFMGPPRTPQLLCGRPGYRFWVADTNGNVSHTYLLKEAVGRASFEVPLLNPGRVNGSLSSNFGRCHLFMDRYVITYNDQEIYFLNLEKLKVQATVKRMRKVICIAICESELFILEGPRTLIRISISPEPPDKTCSKIIFNPTLSGSVILTQSNTSFVPPVEFEAEEEDIVNAEECFELPPIEEIHLTTPLETSIAEHNLMGQDRLLLEHSKKAQIFEKISHLDYDNAILFSSSHRKKKTKKVSGKVSGIVEIGQQVDVLDDIKDDIKDVNERMNTTNVTTTTTKTAELTTRPCLLEVSYCDETGPTIDIRSPNTISNEIETKEKRLAAALNIEPVKFETVKYTPPIAKLTPDIAPEFHYSINYPPYDVTSHTTPLKRIHFLNEENASIDETESLEDHQTGSDDFTHRPSTSSECNSNQATVLDDVVTIQRSSADIPEVKQMPNSMNIPKLWNMTIEKADEHCSESQRSDGLSEWELVDM